MTITGTLPHWDMSQFFPGLDSPELEADLAAVSRQIAALRASIDGLVPGDGTGFDAVADGLNALLDRVRLVRAFVVAFIATDSRNDLAQARYSELHRDMVELTKLEVRFEAWIGSVDVEGLLAASPVAREHEFAVRRAALEAKHQMSAAEEDLAASLQPTGGGAWTRLHGNVTSRLVATVDGRELPMSAVRGLATDPDAGTRRTAYEAELRAWESVEVPLAAALNSIKGEDNVLNARRGWSDSIEPALFANNVDRDTLRAMQDAVAESFPGFRRYLRAKAAALQKSSLPWWDMFAPVGEDTRRWTWDDAHEFVVRQFGTYSDRLAGLADRAFRESWIDAEPRVGKRDGAFCMSIRSLESRVMSNYEWTFSSVSTLAHELGHAYHNMNLAQRTPLNRRTPMALAETASIFCQTIVTNAMLAEASPDERLSILETDLRNACQVVVDIHSRFLFEKFVVEGRERRELSVTELKDAMLDAQRQTYGEGLDPDALHPYMWAVKGHYYGASYYNWPYTFGLLFGVGLYERYREDPDGFRTGYDDLLSSTGLADAPTLASRFGIDVRSVEFWRSSLGQIARRIDEYERLAR
jgi:pepF/M3 family oligoendopeptidase